MNWDEDIDLLAGKKSLPKQGRRSNSNTPGDSNAAGAGEFFNDSNPFDIDNKEERPIMKPRKTSVWGEEGTKSAKSSRSTTNIIEFERFQSENKNSPRQDEDDIPVIPDIDDLQDDPLNLPDVKPIVSVDKSTYKELDNQLGNIQGDKINFGNLGNIDLSFLTNKLYPENELQAKQEELRHLTDAITKLQNPLSALGETLQIIDDGQKVLQTLNGKHDIHIIRHLFLSISWVYLIQGSSLFSHKVQFLPPASSFTRRTDHFTTSSKMPRTSRNIGANFFPIDSPEHIEATLWEPKQGGFHFNSLSFSQHFNGHITPDFSDGLSYPDPFLRTGIQAKRTASYLYSKELFFHNIPHVKGLLYNQEERRRNGLMPNRLGSLRPASPWYRYKRPEGFGVNRIFNLKI